MNYRRRDSVRSGRGKAVRISIAFAAVAACILVRIFAPDFSTRVIQAALAPVARGGDSISESAAASADVFKSKQDLIAENAELRSELKDTQTAASLAEDLQSENDTLRTLLDLTLTTKRTAAVVLSKPPVSPYDSLVVEVGSGATIAVGDKVYGGGNVLLGELSSVSGTTATVKLFSSAGNTIDTVVERNGIDEELTGAGGGNFEIKAPKEVDIAIGDVLAVPGLDGIVVGIVQQIDSRPADSFQDVLVKSPVNIFQLKWVTIEDQK